MISSRWPRPIGIIESMALMPVCSGSFTGWRSMMPGALSSMRRVSRRVDRALAVDRLAERVDDAAEQRLADRHLGDAAGALDLVAFVDLLRLAEDRGADVVLFEVQHHAVDVVRELEQLAGRGLVEAVDAGDAVAGRQHAAGLAHLDLALVLLDLALDDVADFRGANLHSLVPPCVARRDPAARRAARGRAAAARR